MRIFFGFNIFLWCVLFVMWVPFIATMGLEDPVSVRVGLVLALAAVLLTGQGMLRRRRAGRRPRRAERETMRSRRVRRPAEGSVRFPGGGEPMVP